MALVNDYELVVAGLVTMLDAYADRIEVADAVLIGEPIDHDVDVALYDSFGRDGLEHAQLEKLLGQPEVRQVVIYSFTVDPSAVQAAMDAGASGYLSKASPAAQLVDQLERVARGQRVVEPAVGSGRRDRARRGWPGQDLGLSEREAEVVALAVMGRRNADIAMALFVSIDTVKTHLARSFRKLGVHNRTELASLVHRKSSFRQYLSEPD